VDSCGGLYEGLSSNFFAVANGTVYTAGEGVLAGTVREVILQVAQREGIPGALGSSALASMGMRSSACSSYTYDCCWLWRLSMCCLISGCVVSSSIGCIYCGQQ